MYGYTFGELGQHSRWSESERMLKDIRLLFPDDRKILTWTRAVPDTTPLQILGPHNYAFSVAGPADPTGVTLPIALTIVGPTFHRRRRQNPLDPLAGYDYENPMIGKSVWGESCTNKPPQAWMTNFVLQVSVSGLTSGVTYNLYEYEFSSVEGEGSAAALAVPVENFNANAGMATQVTTFTATGSIFTQTVTTTSDKVVVFRCVPVTAL